MIKESFKQEWGAIHTTSFSITVPSYLSVEELKNICDEVELWIDEERKPYMASKVFFSTVYLELYNGFPDKQANLTLYHKVIKRRTYRKIPQIVEEIKNRILAKKPLFHIGEEFKDLLIEKLNER